jgi:hypothetical protein
MDDGGGDLTQTVITSALFLLAGLIGIYYLAHWLLCDAAIAATLLEFGMDPREVAKTVAVKLECAGAGQNPNNRTMPLLERSGPKPEAEQRFGGPSAPTPIPRPSRRSNR